MVLDAEFKYLTLPFEYDLERVIDDFIFLCFFVGNDFLPHLPTFSIRDGGIDVLLDVYKNTLPAMGGYLTHSGDLDLVRLSLYLKDIGRLEEVMIQEIQKKVIYNQRQDQKNEDFQSLDPTNYLEQFKAQLRVIAHAESQKLELKNRSAPVKLKNLQEFKEQYYREKFGVNP